MSYLSGLTALTSKGGPAKNRGGSEPRLIRTSNSWLIPSLSEGSELAHIVHTADYLVRLSGLGYEDDDLMCELEEGALEFLGLEQENFSAITFQVLEYVQKLDSAYHK